MNRSSKGLFLKLFPTPEFLTMPAVGFEVTPEAVRFLEFREKGGLKVSKFFEQRLPYAETEDENFLEGERLSKIVSDIKGKYDLNFISVALPEDKVYLFRMEVPKADEAEIREGIEFKLEEYVPIPPKEAVFDYEIIPQSKSADRLEVNVSVVPRAVAGRYLEFFSKLGFRVASFRVAAQAVADAVIKTGDMSPTIIVNFGQYKTGFYIVSKGLVHFTSTVSVGGASLTEAIKKHFSITFPEAEKIKSEKGIVKDKENIELFFSLINTLSVLKDEINKLSAYWESYIGRDSDTKEKIGKVVVCGEEASIKGLIEYLQASLPMRVSLADVWSNVFSTDHYIPPIERKQSYGFASVIGLAKK